MRLESNYQKSLQRRNEWRAESSLWRTWRIHTNSPRPPQSEGHASSRRCILWKNSAVTGPRPHSEERAGWRASPERLLPSPGLFLRCSAVVINVIVVTKGGCGGGNSLSSQEGGKKGKEIGGHHTEIFKTWILIIFDMYRCYESSN